MTNAPDFNLRDELDATRTWDDADAITLDDDFDVDEGPAYDPDLDTDLAGDDPELDDDVTVGAQDLAERHALRRVAGLRTELLGPM